MRVDNPHDLQAQFGHPFYPRRRIFGQTRIQYTLLTLVAGWWGIHWGPIYSLQCLGTNLGGGKDGTEYFVAKAADAPEPVAVSRPLPAANQPDDISRSGVGIN